MASNQPGLQILQVNTNDINGGASRVAWGLHNVYRQRGHRAWLAVTNKESDDPNVLRIYRPRHLTPGDSQHIRPDVHLWSLVDWLRGVGQLRYWEWIIARAWSRADLFCGVEDFNHPGSRQLLNLPPLCPDLIHAHNLHGGYFDLRYLPSLTKQIPVVLTLHDAWMLSGHCAHSLDCERWRIGCGECPDLNLPQAVRRDATSTNWQRKKRIYGRSRFYVATPSDWLMGKVKQSILAPAIIESRVIPNGIDLSVFQPADKFNVRRLLSISPESWVLLFCADGIRKNAFKDYWTLRRAFALLADRAGDHPFVLLVLGEDAPPEKVGQSEIRFIPYQKDPRVVARYYQAADVYVHSARADTFPNSILEALACGKPVVGTAVGGIPEQIADGKTGFLVPLGDAQAMAVRIDMILSDDALRLQMSRAAIEYAQRYFDLKSTADDYLDWYESILTRWKPNMG